jgi:hypothetical protein
MVLNTHLYHRLSMRRNQEVLHYLKQDAMLRDASAHNKVERWEFSIPSQKLWGMLKNMWKPISNSEVAMPQQDGKVIF